MDQLVNHVAIVSEVSKTKISPSQLAACSAALQKQVTRDFGPIWDVSATVDSFPALEDVPVGYWPVIVQDDIDQAGAAGFHTDRNGQPYALVQFSNSWTLTTSHEVLEMLADPFGNRLQAADSIKPGQGRVEYLVEVCDPSEDDAFSYRVNGVMVSDFYTPNYFDPVAAPGVRYSFNGQISKPREVLLNGYLSWHDPEDNHWYQARWFGTPAVTFEDLGELTARNGDIRSAIDAITSKAQNIFKSLPTNNMALMQSTQCTDFGEKASRGAAKSLREDINKMLASVGGKKKPAAAKRARPPK